MQSMCIYRNKNREFAKEALQNLYVEQAKRQGVREHPNFEIKSTQSKTNSCNIIKFHFLILIFVFVCFEETFASNCSSVLNITKPKYQQWFTGPILTPTPITMPVGHPGLEVAWLVGETYGHYNSHWNIDHIPSIWSTGPYVDFQVGFNEFLGAEYIGALLTNFSQGAHYTHVIDSIFRLGFQILTDKKDSWIPDFRILLQETVPTGKYQKLNPKKHGTDVTGRGSFQTGIHFAFQKLFRSTKGHNFRLRWTFGYFVPAPVHVSGINYLGGTKETKGKVYPGRYFSGYISSEYALSRTWAVCLESNYRIGHKGKFCRKKGPKIAVPSFRQISIAPELQHTFTSNLGILTGAWLTVTGRNSVAFRDFFISVLYAF